MKTIFIFSSPEKESEFINIFWNRFLSNINIFYYCVLFPTQFKRPSKIKDNSELEQHSVFKYHIDAYKIKIRLKADKENQMVLL